VVTALLVGAGGFIGAVSRYFLSGLVQNVSGNGDFPWGTLAVNVVGCLAIGLLMGIAENRECFGLDARAFIFIGVLGGFTTFSAFGWETIALLKNGEVLFAVTNIILQIILGIGGAGIGYFIGMRSMFSL